MKAWAMGRARRRVGLAVLLVAVALGILGPRATRACWAFSDVPPEYWAYAWIDWLTGTGVVGGYDDGTYKPADPVDRAQMAVFVTRAMQWGTARQAMGFSFMPDRANPDTVGVLAPGLSDPGEYRLYESTDGITFSLATSATFMEQFTEDFVWWWVPGVTATRYFKPMKLLSSGPERELCPMVAGRGSKENPHTITISEPPLTDASRLPVITWSAVPGAVAYLVGVGELTPPYGHAYAALVDASRTSIWMAHTSGPGVITAWREVSALDPVSSYVAVVCAFRATGEDFVDNELEFTTGADINYP